MLSVSTITTRNNKDIKSIFGTNVYLVPGSCLLDIGGAPYAGHKIMAQKPYFYIFDFFSENHQQMAHYIMPENSLNLGHNK